MRDGCCSFAKVPRNRAWLTAFHFSSAGLLHSIPFCGFWLVVVSGTCDSELRVFLTSLTLSGSCSLLASFGSNLWFQLLVFTSLAVRRRLLLSFLYPIS